MGMVKDIAKNCSQYFRRIKRICQTKYDKTNNNYEDKQEL